MKSRRKLLAKSRLYLILDIGQCVKKPLSRLIKQFSRSWVIIQLRDKTATRESITAQACLAKAALKNNNTLFIVNDDVIAAKISGADGVHLGQTDTSIKEARRILGKNKIIGKSCHSLAQAIKAEKEGADYLGIGPVFPSPLKPDLKAIGLRTVASLKDKIKIPYYAIGGIDLFNLDQVLKTGCRKVAVCRSVLKAKNPRKAMQNFKTKLNRNDAIRIR